MMIIRQTTTIVFEYPQDYLQEQEWCKTKDDRWVHKGTDTLGAVYENQISYSIGVSADRKTENSSEIPNNCEHITEDGVTCAKYPACDDCLDNPLNKLKGSERLVKGSEQTDCQTCKWGEWYRQGYDITMMDDECGGCCSWNSKWIPKTESTISKMEQVDDEPRTCDNCKLKGSTKWCNNQVVCRAYKPMDEPQTENPCDGCVCDDGKHLMYCMNCKGIAWKTEPPKVEDVPKAGMSDMSEIDKMIKMVDGILGDDDLCEGCEYVIEGLSCDECRRKYADKIIKILRNVKRKPQTDCAWK